MVRASSNLPMKRSMVWKSPRGVSVRNAMTRWPATYTGAPKILVMRPSSSPPISRMVIVPDALPLSVCSTVSFVSVQMRPSSRSTGCELTTVPSTISGVFATSCASVGRMMVVAAPATAISEKTHVNQYTRKRLIKRKFSWGWGRRGSPGVHPCDGGTRRSEALETEWLFAKRGSPGCNSTRG